MSFYTFDIRLPSLKIGKFVLRAADVIQQAAEAVERAGDVVQQAGEAVNPAGDVILKQERL